jgi:hypothetical protein
MHGINRFWTLSPMFNIRAEYSVIHGFKSRFGHRLSWSLSWMYAVPLFKFWDSASQLLFSSRGRWNRGGLTSKTRQATATRDSCLSVTQVKQSEPPCCCTETKVSVRQEWHWTAHPSPVRHRLLWLNYITFALTNEIVLRPTKCYLFKIIYIFFYFSGPTAQQGPGPPHSWGF